MKEKIKVTLKQYQAVFCNLELKNNDVSYRAFIGGLKNFKEEDVEIEISSIGKTLRITYNECVSDTMHPVYLCDLVDIYDFSCAGRIIKSYTINDLKDIEE